jgi:hypothetical protein
MAHTLRLPGLDTCGDGLEHPLLENRLRLKFQGILQTAGNSTEDTQQDRVNQCRQQGQCRRDEPPPEAGEDDGSTEDPAKPQQ